MPSGQERGLLHSGTQCGIARKSLSMRWAEVQTEARGQPAGEDRASAAATH